MDNQLLTELKEYAFAPYIGQNFEYDFNDVVRKSIPLTGVTIDSAISHFEKSSFISPRLIAKNCTLQLRPLSSITDDEAKILFRLEHDYRLLRWRNENLSTGEHVGYYGYNDTIINCGLHFNSLKYTSYQYLQQQGFALPIYFKGVQYSVEQLVELGIYTLKQ